MLIYIYIDTHTLTWKDTGPATKKVFFHINQQNSNFRSNYESKILKMDVHNLLLLIFKYVNSIIIIKKIDKD